MKRKRIYVADDDKDILEILTTILEWEGIGLIASTDGLSLTTLSDPPNMVFRDIAMPVSDGSYIYYQYKNDR